MTTLNVDLLPTPIPLRRAAGWRVVIDDQNDLVVRPPSAGAPRWEVEWVTLNANPMLGAKSVGSSVDLAFARIIDHLPDEYSPALLSLWVTANEETP